jgi:hypothetical protein
LLILKACNRFLRYFNNMKTKSPTFQPDFLLSQGEIT